MKTFLRLLTVFGVFALAARAQTTVYWNFSSGSGDPTQLSANVTGGVITAFNGDPGYTPAFDMSQPSSGYSGLQGPASGMHNASVQVQNFVGSVNSLADAANPSATYFEFTLAPTVGLQLQASAFELGSRSKPGGGAGPTTLTLVASTDNFTSNFTQLGTTTVLANGTWALATVSFGSTYTAPVDTPVTFRIYGTDGTGGIGTANWRIDDVSLTVIAVPEPSTYASLLLGVVLLGARALRRRKSAVA